MSTFPRVIGIAGANGAGKDTVGAALAEHFGYVFHSVSDSLREEARRRGLSVERKNLSAISAEWRRESGNLGVLIDKSVAMFSGANENIALASLRNPGEVDAVHRYGGIVLWVDADQRVRYERIQSASRGRDEEDNKSFEEFVQEELEEMNQAGDEATLSVQKVREKVDYVVDNGGSIEDLITQIERILGSL
jgi:dephospho-CoA kinase